MDIRRKLISLLLLCIGAYAIAADEPRPPPLALDDGQYRSKVRIIGADEPPPAELSRASLDESGASGYARALALRHFAYEALSDGDTAQAITDFEQALQSGGLSDAAADEMRFNLGPLYFSAGRYKEAEPLLVQRRRITGEADIDMMLAAARVELGNLNGAAEPLRRALATTKNPPAEWLELALYIATERGDYTRARQYASRVIDLDPDNGDAWRRLAEIARLSGAADEALAALIVLREAGLATPNDWPRLAWSYRAAGLPYEGAAFIESRLAADELPGNIDNYTLLAETWLAAGETNRAYTAMLHAAEVGRDKTLYYRAGELAVRLERFGDARAALEEALRGKTLVDNRSTALMLLGFVQYRLEDTRAARNTFEEAAELGGNYRAAQAWLDYLEPRERPSRATAMTGNTDTAQRAEGSAKTRVAIETKSVPRQHFFFTSLDGPAERAIRDSLPDIPRLINETRRERLSWNGPLHLILLRRPAAAGNVTVQVAAPVRNKVTGSRGFRSRTSERFDCAWRDFDGSANALSDAWQAFADDFAAAGLNSSGEVRIVVHSFDREQGNGQFELQIGLERDDG